MEGVESSGGGEEEVEDREEGDEPEEALWD